MQIWSHRCVFHPEYVLANYMITIVHAEMLSESVALHVLPKGGFLEMFHWHIMKTVRMLFHVVLLMS